MDLLNILLGGGILAFIQWAVDKLSLWHNKNDKTVKAIEGLSDKVEALKRTYNIYKNTAGHYQTEYADYIREVAKSYCLPVLDLTVESGFCPFIDEFRAMWTLTPSGYSTPDGVHPTAEYSEKYLAPMIANYLLGIS